MARLPFPVLVRTYIKEPTPLPLQRRAASWLFPTAVGDAHILRGAWTLRELLRVPASAGNLAELLARPDVAATYVEAMIHALETTQPAESLTWAVPELSAHHRAFILSSGRLPAVQLLACATESTTPDRRDAILALAGRLAASCDVVVAALRTVRNEGDLLDVLNLLDRDDVLAFMALNTRKLVFGPSLSERMWVAVEREQQKATADLPDASATPQLSEVRLLRFLRRSTLSPDTLGRIAQHPLVRQVARNEALRIRSALLDVGGQDPDELSSLIVKEYLRAQDVEDRARGHQLLAQVGRHIAEVVADDTLPWPEANDVLRALDAHTPVGKLREAAHAILKE